MTAITRIRMYETRLIGPIAAPGIAAVKKKCAEHGIEYVESYFVGFAQHKTMSTPNNPNGIEQQPMRACLVCMDFQRGTSKGYIHEYFKKAFEGLPVSTVSQGSDKDRA